MMSRLLPVLLTLCLTLAPAGCSDDEGCTDDEVEQGGPGCCAGGCGVGTDGWSPRVCKEGVWICEGSAPALEDACASPMNACTPMEGCHVIGLDQEEPDPAPELCCEESSCSSTKAVHRVCKTGTQWECPAGTVPISRCKDYRNACDGILKKYKDNGYKLPY